MPDYISLRITWAGDVQSGAAAPTSGRTTGPDRWLRQAVPSAPASIRSKTPSIARSRLATGNGWFEVFFVPKRSYKKEVIAYGKAWGNYLDHGSPLPSEGEQALDGSVAKNFEQRK